MGGGLGFDGRRGWGGGRGETVEVGLFFPSVLAVGVTWHTLVNHCRDTF